MDTGMLNFISDLIIWGTVALQVGVLVLIVLVFLPHTQLAQRTARVAHLKAFIVTALALAGSFFYSEFLDFAPCTLCWYQRIVAIVQVAVLGITLVRRDERGLAYAAAVAVVGACIALYHVLLPLFETSYVCLPGEVSCLEEYFTGLGYITIPVMSLTVFATTLLLWAVEKRSKKSGIVLALE